MGFLYFHPSGHLYDREDCPLWTLAVTAVPRHNWKPLQLRLNSLQQNFQKSNYAPGRTALRASRLLPRRRLGNRWTFGLIRGVQRVTGQLHLPLFLVVIDKRLAHRPASPDWLLPLGLRYLEAPLLNYLENSSEMATMVMPATASPVEREAFQRFQERLQSPPGEADPPLCGGTCYQTPCEAAGLQVSALAAALSRVYHLTTAPRLRSGQPLDDYHKAIEELYQGFVKANTYRAPRGADPSASRGFIYLWRKPPTVAHPAEGETEDTAPPPPP